MSDREVLAKRLNQVGLLEDRLIPVRDGTKQSVVAHQKAGNRYSNFAGISGNYGVYAGDGLVDVDVDDYSDDADNEGLEAVNDLPETLTVESPHTDGETGGHRYYKVTTDRTVDDYDVDRVLSRYIKDDGEKTATYLAAKNDPVALGIADTFGKPNLGPSWGELRVCNQYVVGPGSELDSCDKDWHDCSKAGEGQYRITTDAPIAEITLEELIDVLKASGIEETEQTGGQNGTNGNLSTGSDSDGYEEALEVARNDPKIVTYLTDGAGVDFDGDRSDADFYVACRMIEEHVPKQQAEKLLLNGLGEENTPNTKVRERGGWYANTWENARRKVKQSSDSDNSSNDGDGESDGYGDIVVENGHTYYQQNGERVQVLNFALDVDWILRLDSREVIEADLRRPGGASDSVQFEPRHLQKKQRFKDNVLDGKFGFTFTPPSRQSETVLNALNEYIGQLDLPIRKGTHHIGLHGTEWVTPNGSLGPDGWIEEPEYVYVERNVALERVLSLPETAAYDENDVQEILTGLLETRETARMLAVLGWFYAAPLRPYIFEEWGAGAFNHLNITGDTGSGKTTTLRYLWRCFGVESDPFAVTDTKFAMLSALAASNGLPVWYDEYKPSEIQDYRLDQFHDLYRKAATGGTATRGRADQTTEEYHTHAPIVVSGEEQIRRPAERRRSIMVAFREDVTDKGTETRKAFKSLVGEGRIENGELVLPKHAPEPANHAVAYYRWITDVDSTELRAKWQDAREVVWQKRQEWEGEFDLDDMEVQGLQTVTFGWMVMRAFAREHGVALSDLPDESDLDDALRHVAGEIGPSGQRKSHMDRFVELFERATAAEYVERGQHFEVVHERKSGAEEIRIHLSRTYDALSKYARDHGLENEELLSNAQDYRKRFKEAAKSNDSYVTTHSQKTPGLGRCVGIQTVAAMRELDFDRHTFDLEPIEDSVEWARRKVVEVVREADEPLEKTEVKERATMKNVRPETADAAIEKAAEEKGDVIVEGETVRPG